MKKFLIRIGLPRIKMLNKVLFVVGLSILATACVSPILLYEQLPLAEYTSGEMVLISVVDQRARVEAEGKPKDFVGVAHGSFGIPTDWHVRQVLATAEGDNERDLASFLQHRIFNGLQESGWNVRSVNVNDLPTDEEARTILDEYEAKKIITLMINEWYFSINLNFVSAFNFDTDTEIVVQDLADGVILTKNFKERDVIDERASESAQNNVLRAYKAQLTQILNDPEVCASLGGLDC